MVLAILLGSLVGLSLGLTGGGGSIFAVPLLIYGLGLDFRQAVALSLAIVGATALYGAALQARAGLVLWGAGAVLGFGGILTAPFGAFVGRHIPHDLSILMFAGLMGLIGYKMMLGRGALALTTFACPKNERGELSFSWRCALKLVGTGMIAGTLSGIFGVGGGFLIVPALLMVTGISIESAMGTSLVSIALISLSGFLSNISALSAASISLAMAFFIGACLGMTAGTSLKSHLPAIILRRLFGIMILVTAAILVFTALT